MPYSLPPRDVLEAFDAPPPPIARLSPDGSRLALITPDLHPPIEQLARPFLRLGGVRVDPARGCRQRTVLLRAVTLVGTSDNSEVRVGLPDGATIGVPLWSPDGSRLAFTLDADDGVELWVADAETGRARPLSVRVNDVLSDSGMMLGLPGVAGAPFAWARGSDALLVRLVTGSGRPPDPAAGPRAEETAGKQSQMATFQDLLAGEGDETLFEHYGLTQLGLVDVESGVGRTVSDPMLLLSARPAPDGEHILVTRVTRPFSYRVPAQLFARRIEVLDGGGAVSAVVADLPVSDEVPRQGVPTGPRSPAWHEHRPCTVLWVEALDGGDPTVPAEHRDRLMAMAVGESPVEVRRITHRFAGLSFLEDGRALITQRDRDRRWRTTALVDLDAGTEQVLFDLSVHDDYGDPGTPVTTTRADGAALVAVHDASIWLAGRGASPEGDRPFLDRFDLPSATASRLWRCAEGRYEAFVGFAGARDRILIRTESPAEPTNYEVVGLPGSDGVRLTFFGDPHPAITASSKRIVRYRRDDGVDLSGTLHVPAGHVPGTRLPVLIWAYPYDYSDPATAGQVRGSDAVFTRLAGASPLWLLTQGFAVLMDAQMPILGDPDAMNDTFVDQLRANAKAAIDALDDLGVADRERIVVAGHSYGGFMTANLLAHTDWFAAGIARSGAHNRTLTPFGFQTERRSFWEAPDVYLRMSPFAHADKIKTPILLVHGQEDNNSGTFPIQSERLYQAIQGLGGTARLVMLPHESHGYRARESVLHTIAEMIDWALRWTRVAEREPVATASE